MTRRRNAIPVDLDPYEGCDDQRNLSLTPLAVGWLRRGDPFASGDVPADVVIRLLEFCREDLLVCRTPAVRPCPLDSACGRVAAVDLPDGGMARFGDGEIRVIGDDDVYAAPSLIHHYITVHGYQPPAEFIKALRKGAAPGSPEHRAYLKALNG